MVFEPSLYPQIHSNTKRANYSNLFTIENIFDNINTTRYC
uniref:Uncharacterized protein n=1 Tax=Acinetobacter phage P919 TaxID=3229763 RepID=A0AB39AIS3_9CAUD